MRDLTLFQMYRKYVRRRTRALESRRTRQGIAVHTDQYALQWQAWNKLCTLLAKELERRLQ